MEPLAPTRQDAPDMPPISPQIADRHAHLRLAAELLARAQSAIATVLRTNDDGELLLAVSRTRLALQTLNEAQAAR